MKNCFAGPLNLFIYVEDFQHITVFFRVYCAVIHCFHVASRYIVRTEFTLTVCSVRACVLLDCKIQLLFQFPFLFDILNQCDNLIFRHFFVSPSLHACSCAVLPASLPLRLSSPLSSLLALSLFLPRAHRCRCLPPSFHTASPFLSPPLPSPLLLFVYLHAGSPLLPSLSSSS